jgi:hypothetical protein
MVKRELAVVFMLALAPLANAGAVYTYIGQNFTVSGGMAFSGPIGSAGPWVSSDHLTASLEFDSPLPANMAFGEVTAALSSWMITDGYTTITPTNPNTSFFGASLQTDSAGDIVAWGVGGSLLLDGTAYDLQTVFYGDWAVSPEQMAVNSTGIRNAWGGWIYGWARYVGAPPGSWNHVDPGPGSATPEPAASALAISGFAILLAAGVWRKRYRLN